MNLDPLLLGGYWVQQRMHIFTPPRGRSASPIRTAAGPIPEINEEALL